MKKVLKYIGIGIVVSFVALIVLGNLGKILMSIKQKEYGRSLEGMISEVNKHLPHKGFDGFDFFIMNRAFLEENNVVWEVTLDTTFFYPIRESFLPESMNGGILPEGNRSMALDLDTLLSSNLLRQSYQLNLLYYHLFAKTGKPNPLYEEIMNRKYSQTWRIKSPFSNRQYEFNMKYEEMKEAEDFCKRKPDEALDLFMLEYLKRQNRLLTYASGNADINMHMSDEGEAIVFRCIFDKSYSSGGNKPISNLRVCKEEIAEGLKEDMNTLPFFYGYEEICKKANKKILFRYTDWNKTDSIELRFY